MRGCLGSGHSDVLLLQAPPLPRDILLRQASSLPSVVSADAPPLTRDPLLLQAPLFPRDVLLQAPPLSGHEERAGPAAETSLGRGGACYGRML
ncbi:hypothetical protein NDU88_008383 [Pleurodeles waltl]|uniref:Uncharacterized protein n=1 Tax=Pleurodeles waltl TaxID=8319 RepID=A0AAV7SV74_PLEWA|nr:hypothetical protein NDU88_008383 [Pleurodeles waltl]